MKLPFKIVTLAIITLAVFTFAYTSCTKDNTKSTTVIKCVTCANGGLCINDTCRCPSGYEGLTCQTMSREKFAGSWTVNETGSSSGTAQYSDYIQYNFSSLKVDSVYFGNFYNFYFYPYPIGAHVAKDSIFIPLQKSNGKIVVGKGHIDLPNSFGQFTRLTLYFKITDTATGITDDFGYDSPTVNTPSIWTRN